MAGFLRLVLTGIHSATVKRLFVVNRVFRGPHKGLEPGVERGGHAVGPPAPIRRS
jgi:hypothetical protein